MNSEIKEMWIALMLFCEGVEQLERRLKAVQEAIEKHGIHVKISDEPIVLPRRRNS